MSISSDFLLLPSEATTVLFQHRHKVCELDNS